MSDNGELIRHWIDLYANGPVAKPPHGIEENPHVRSPSGLPYCVICGCPEDVWGADDVVIEFRTWFDVTNAEELYRDRHGEAPGSPSKRRRVVPRHPQVTDDDQASRTRWDDLLNRIEGSTGVRLLPWQRRWVRTVLDADERGERVTVIGHGRQIGRTTALRTLRVARAERDAQQQGDTMDQEQRDALMRILGEAVGAASTCWIGGTGAAVFDTEQANKVVDETFGKVAAIIEQVSVKEVPVVVPED